MGNRYGQDPKMGKTLKVIFTERIDELLTFNEIRSSCIMKDYCYTSEQIYSGLRYLRDKGFISVRQINHKSYFWVVAKSEKKRRG